MQKDAVPESSLFISRTHCNAAAGCTLAVLSHEKHARFFKSETIFTEPDAICIGSGHCFRRQWSQASTGVLPAICFSERTLLRWVISADRSWKLQKAGHQTLALTVLGNGNAAVPAVPSVQRWQ